MENKHLRDETNNNDEFINLADIIRIFTKNWKWFALSIFLFLGLGALYLMMKNPVYEVDALALLKEDEKKSSASSMSMMSNLSDLGSMMGSKNIDNEVVIFNTRRIMRQSILDLNLHVATYAHRYLKTINVYPERPFDIQFDQTKADTISTPVELTLYKQNDGSYKVKGKYMKKKFKTKISSFPAVINTPAMDVHIDKKPPMSKLTEKATKFDVVIANPNRLAVTLQKEVSSSATSKKTTVIHLTTETDNIKWGQDLLNKLIEKFNLDALTDKNQIAALTLQFVNERIQLVEEEIAGVEKQVERYKVDNKLVDLSTEARIYLSQMTDYNSRAIQTRTQLRMIGYIEEYVRDNKNKTKLIPTIGIEDRGLVAVIAGYNEMLTERITLEHSSTASNPALNLLDEQLNSIRQNILANIDNLTKSMQIVLKDLETQDSLAGGRIQKVPAQERAFVEIVRQQGIRNTIYAFLLQKREETSLNLASATPKARIIDEPMPGTKPVAPRKMIITAIFLCLGVVVPFAFFYLKNMLRTDIASKEELESLSEVEVIGEICRDSQSDKVVVKPNATSPSVELFRLLRTNLSFVQKSPTDKVVMLTSTISGEGKTFISINLAMSFALMDKKVVVVGLDIRNPRLGDYIDVPTGKGVTNYLIDHSLRASDIIQHSGVHANLDIIQAGPVPPNPNELLLNARMESFFTEIRDKYDYIIVDTAPVGLVSDTFLLDRFADVTLYVSRIGVAKKDSVKYVNSIHRKGKLRNLYLVANDVDLKEKNGGYGYGYGNEKK